MDYRKYYRETLKIEEDISSFDIHHIDFNRENNTLYNLVLLPRKLHHSYHFRLSGVQNIEIVLEPKSVIDCGGGLNDFTMNNLYSFISVWREVCKWVDYRNYLLGHIPNIHNIKLGE